MVLAVLVIAPVVRAQGEPEVPIPVDVEADGRGAPIRVLTLDDALRLGRTQNAELRAAELVPEQVRMDLLYAEAAFEPELYANSTYTESRSPERSALQPSTTRTTLDGAIGWRQRVVTGGLFDLAFHPAQYVTSGSSLFPDRLYTAEFAATYRQPLLRGGWSDYNLAPVRTAGVAYAQARNELEGTVQATLQAIVVAYWELCYSRENYRVVLSALGVAREQLRITEERIRVSDLAPRDRVADEAEVARRQEEVITAENAIRTREDNLRRLLFGPEDKTFWATNLRPVSSIAIDPSGKARDYEPLVAVALANRPDLQAQIGNVARSEVAVLEAERGTLPSLDLVTAWSSDGARDQFRHALADSSEVQFPDWSVGIEFAMPLGNHAAKAAAQKASLELERQRRLQHAQELEITKEVREAVRNLNSLAQSIQASSESLRLAQSNLETEQVKLRVGASTAFEVQRRNQDLQEARSRHLRNQLDYRVAESRLLYVQGILSAPR